MKGRIKFISAILNRKIISALMGVLTLSTPEKKDNDSRRCYLRSNVITSKDYMRFKDQDPVKARMKFYALHKFHET